jgi:zinc protease
MQLLRRWGASVVLAALQCALIFTAVRAQSQPLPARPLAMDAVIPFDAAVRRGTLPNGMSYYIRQNGRPENRLLVRLAVKAGSLDEVDDQQGLAHFIEHMAFNGSTHFKPGELISYFESTGARLGPHVNAYTSFEETVYMLEVPTDKPEFVRQGLTALADFAGGLTFEPAEVERERGVVLEEWRGRLGAGSRVQDQQIPVLFHDSRYAARLPIGKPEIIQNAPVARLRAFYDDWYRPEHMSVVIVGAADPDAMEAQLRELFGPLKARGTTLPRQARAVPLHRDLLVSVVADPEVTASSVQVLRKLPAQEDNRVGDYRRLLVGQLFSTMFNDRLNEMARRPDAPFLAAGVGISPLNPNVDTFSISVRVVDGRMAPGLTATMVEARRIGEFGFLEAELDRAKRNMAAGYARAFNERDRTESGSYAREYVSHFLTGEPSPGIQYEYQIVQQVLPGITLDEVTGLARSYIGEPHVVLAVVPQRADAPAPASADLGAAISAANAVAIAPWTEAGTANALMAAPPSPGAVESRRELADLGVTIVRFANGVEAWLKPTDFKNDQVVFTLYAQGGISLAPAADFVSASLSTGYIGLGGVGGLSPIELQRVTAGKVANANPFVQISTHGISGSASPGDLETALQRLHLSFTSPNDDPEAFALLRRQLEAAVANRGQSPGQVFGERVSEINSSGHFTSQPLTAEAVAALDRDTMLRFYRERFSNAADFTFFMVGTFDPATVTPLLATYVGSLPSTGPPASRARDLDRRFPSAIVRDRVVKGREPRANAVVSFYAEPGADPVEQERILAATNVLETALRDTLREELGQTYTVSVGLAQSLPQRGDGHVRVTFGGAPANIDAMVDRVIAQVRTLAENGPSDDLTSRAKEGARRDYETALRQNGYWLGRLQGIHLLGGDPREILTREARIQAVTPSVLRDTFRRYFPLDRYTVVTLVPE